MPRAAQAIIAIACSAGALGPPSIVAGEALRCSSKKDSRVKPLTSIGALKDVGWQIHLETTSEQQEAIRAKSATWGDVDEVAHPLLDLDDGLSGSSPSLEVSLPEDVVMNVLTYTGVAGRRASRVARSQCDESLHESLLLPEFPVNFCIKQHYHFGSEQTVTSTWSVDVSSTSAAGVMELHTEAGSTEREGDSVHTSVHSSGQVFRLWQALNLLRKDVGVNHIEDGKVQVDVTVTDAAGRALLDHRYRHRTFRSKADELLEIVSEPDAIDSPPLVGRRVASRMVSHSSAGGRPRSGHRQGAR